MKDTLANPIIQDEKKKQVLSTIAREAGFTESTLSFLSLLVDARRIDAIDEIVEAFETKYCVLTDTQARPHCRRYRPYPTCPLLRSLALYTCLQVTLAVVLVQNIWCL